MPLGVIFKKALESRKTNCIDGKSKRATLSPKFPPTLAMPWNAAQAVV